MDRSGALALSTSYQTVVTGALATEGNLFGLVFTNTSGGTRVVTLEHYRSSIAATVELAFPIANNTLPWRWPAQVSLQPGDTVRLKADGVVGLLWSYVQEADVDPGSPSFTLKGAWNSTDAFDALDIVSHGGSTYAAIQPNTNSAPAAGAHTANWFLLFDASTLTGELLSANNLSDLASASAARANLGLGNVDNTSDAGKPLSSAATTALAAKLALAGGTMTGPITLSADAANPLEPVSKQQLDALLLGAGKRGRVRAATTANITISTALNNGDVLDGVTLATNDLVLVKDQTTASQNGVYVVGASPARAPEFDTYNEHPGSLIAVAEGSSNADCLFICTSNDGGTLNTTALVFVRIRIDITIPVPVAQGGTGASDAATARDNLGVTALLAGKDALGHVSVVPKTASYTLAANQIGEYHQLSHASTAIVVTVPPNSSVAFAIGDYVEFDRDGVAECSFVEGAGVTIKSVDSKKKLNKQNSTATLTKVATDTWKLAGDLKA